MADAMRDFIAEGVRTLETKEAARSTATTSPISTAAASPTRNTSYPTRKGHAVPLFH